MNLRHAPRLFVPAPLAGGAALELDKEPAHYLLNVLRARAGDTVRLFNGQDGEWRAEVGEISKKSVTLTPREQIRPQTAESTLSLLCAPIKKAHFDFMIEKATELGVSRIQPILTARTQVREVNTDRARAIAVEAAEQSERLSIPAIAAPVELKKLIATWPRDISLIICAEWGEAQPVGEAFVKLDNGKNPTSILTGPEGGFAPEEMELLRAVPGARFIRLGPRILRADTAAVAALSCWQAMRGDWV